MQATQPPRLNPTSAMRRASSFGAAPQPFESGGGVGDEMRAGEVALRAPGAAVVQVENVQADLAKVDGQVEVLLVTGKAVEQQGGGARIVAGGAIETAEKTRSPGWDERRLEPGCRHVRALKGRCPSPRSRSRLAPRSRKPG